MAKNEVIIPAKVQEFNYRACSECGRKIHDTRVMERKVYVPVAANVGHAGECSKR